MIEYSMVRLNGYCTLEDVATLRMTDSLGTGILGKEME
jgi:hypothetical protein